MWDARLLIEDRAVLEALHPVPVPTDCNESRWMSGYLPKLALTPDGDPRAVFVAQRVTSGHGADGRTCDGRTDVISARISLFPQPRSSDP